VWRCPRRCRKTLRFTDSFLGRVLEPRSKCGRGRHWRRGVGGGAGMQAVSDGCRYCLGEQFLDLRLVPWVGRGGRHLSAKRPWEFVECASGDLVVCLGGVVPWSISGVRPVIMVGLLASCGGVERRSWVFSVSALCFNFLSCMGQIVLGLIPNSLLF
jgi:hypothetical protein